MKSVVRIACLVVLLLACLNGAWAAKTAVEAKTTPPTKAGALLLAEKYLKEVTPKLTMEEKTTLDGIVFTLKSQSNVPTLQHQAIEELVNHTALALAKTEGIEAVIVTSATLMKLAPANARVENLFGVTLHAIGRNRDAIPVLEYTRTLEPKSELVMLNAANTYLDLDQDAKAKVLIDKVLAQNDKNKSAYSALACYWYKKGDLNKALAAMMKASSFGGAVVQRKAEENHKVVEKNLASGGDALKAIEQKLDSTKDLTPKTTADLIEDQFPDAAKQIRDRYCKLIDSEKMIMPPLPQVNVSGLKNWLEMGEPFMKEWQDAFSENCKSAMFEVAHLQAGINRGDSKAVIKQKGMAAAAQQMEKSLADAAKMMKLMENMPGISKSQLAQVKREMQKAMGQSSFKTGMAKLGVKTPPIEPSSVDDDTIKSDADLQKYEAADLPPGFDSGSVFAIHNYRDYMLIRNNYEIYFLKYWKKYNAMVMDILKVYSKKAAEEDKLHENNLEEIKKKEDEARKAVELSGGVFVDTKFELERRKEILRYKKTMNALGDDFFAQWVHYALPQYQKKMKPMLDQFWAVCALYIRNMNNPDVMKVEYVRVKQAFWMHAGYAVGSMNCAGTFRYMGETDEEERQLEADIKAAEEDAKGKHDEYKGQTKTAESAFEKWIEDTFALAVKGEFLSLRISPRKLTIEEYIAGMNFKHVYDFKTGEWTTYRSFAAKIDIGIQVGPLKVGVEARADFLESYDTINVRSGQVVNSGSRFATGSAGVYAGDPNVKVGGGVQVTLDPAAENELSVKFTKSMGAKGKLGNGVDWGVKAP